MPVVDFEARHLISLLFRDTNSRGVFFADKITRGRHSYQ